MNVEQIRAKLAALKETQTKTPQTGGNQDLFWKPTATKTSTGQAAAGEYNIRILPNIYNSEMPFSELKFYYNFGKTWLAPCQFDRRDPAVEAYNAIIPEGTKIPKDEWMALANFRRKLEPADRYYVAVLIRGKEHEGPKYWGFTKKIYESLLEYFADEEWGDLSDLKTGTDLKVVYSPPEVNGTDYPSTKIIPARKSTVATEDKAVLEKINAMPELKTLFTEPSYDELLAAVEKYLNVKTPEPKNEVATAKASSASTSTINEIVDDFDALFNDMDNSAKSDDDDMSF